MSRRTVDDVVAYAGRGGFDCVDITGGAPELLPDLDRLLEGVAPLCRKLMLRTNLTALEGADLEALIDRCRRLRVTLVASFPSLSANQTDSQRGKGVWKRSAHMLRILNRIGYGLNGTGLELDLVVNPAGAFMPAGQCEVEARYRRDLLRRWGISFNSLYSFANVPLGRFRRWLLSSGNYDQYLAKLTGSFNPDSVANLMCRSLISVSWEGLLYDCDFNQAAGLGHGDLRTHVTSQSGAPPVETPVAVGDHCYACTAGTGFT